MRRRSPMSVFVSKCPCRKTKTGGKRSRSPPESSASLEGVANGYHGNHGGGCCCCEGVLRSSGGLSVFMDIHSEARGEKVTN